MNHEPDLELSAGAMREMVELALRRVLAYVESLPSQPAIDIEGCEELAREVKEPLPQAGRPFPQILDLLFDRYIPKGYNTAGPGYMAYIPGGGIFHTAVADFISDATNRYVGVWAAAPALAQIEATVIGWFGEILGYPQTARGILTTGGSLANFIAVATARRDRLPDNFLRGTVYASDQVHHSVAKAAMLAGFPEANIRIVACDGRFRMDPARLQRAVREDRASGFTPFLLVASAGTTNTGAVDDLEELSAIAAAEDLWLHVDAAYGGFFMLTDRGRAAMRGIERADSVTLDPHKGLFLPYGTGSLLVRDGAALRRAHEVHGHYMPPMQSDPDFVDFCLHSPELSRDFRGLRVWLPFKMHGVGSFRRCLDEKLDLARYAASELAGIPGIEIVAEPQLSIVAFRLAARGATREELDRLNRDMLDRVNARRRVFLTSTILGERLVQRICVLHFRTHRDHVRQALEDIRRAAEVTASR